MAGTPLSAPTVTAILWSADGGVVGADGGVVS